MSNTIPSLDELRAEFLSNIESALNLNTPDNEKSFNKVLATAEAGMAKLIHLYCASQIKEVFVRTASMEGLLTFGEGYNVYPHAASRWSGTLRFAFPAYQKIPLATVFISASGNKYITKKDYYADAAGYAYPVAEAIAEGASSNLEAGYQLEIQVPVQGAATTAIITDVLTLGAQAETTESYRQRLFDIQQLERGGNNAGDYRVWAQAVPGVKRAYPFTGRPIGMTGNSLPLECTIYIECDESIDPDGIPPQSLLDNVKDALLFDPDTGEGRLLLGHTSDVIYVRPIVRNGIYITIIGLNVSDISNVALIQQEIRTAVDNKLRSIEPFVSGLDPEFNKNEKVTESILMQEIQNIIDAYNGTIDNILFGFILGENTSRIVLNRNQKLKLADIIFGQVG